MLGAYSDARVLPYEMLVSATCTRVPVIDGHLVNVSIDLASKPAIDDVIAAWEGYTGDERVAMLPSAPERPLQYLPQVDRPQPRRDRNAGGGMMTSIGRLRECTVLGYKFAALSHNTIRGAAGSSVLNAELLAVSGYLHNFQPEVAVALP